MMCKLSRTKLITLSHLSGIIFGIMIGELLGSRRIPLWLNAAAVLVSGVVSFVLLLEVCKRNG